MSISIVSQGSRHYVKHLLYLREAPIIPEVSMVGETIADVTELALLYVLLDGVQGLFLGDLERRIRRGQVDWEVVNATL